MGRFNVKVVPGSSRDHVIGWLGDALKITVASPAEKRWGVALVWRARRCLTVIDRKGFATSHSQSRVLSIAEQLQRVSHGDRRAEPAQMQLQLC